AGGDVLDALQRRIRFHVPEQVACPRERGQQDAHRLAAGKRADDTGDADARAKIGAAGNDGLQGLACTLRADILEHEVVPLEDARVLAERGRLILPIVDLADRDLELILRARRRTAEAGEHDQRQAEAAPQRIPRSVRSHRGYPPLFASFPALGFYPRPEERRDSAA